MQQLVVNLGADPGVGSSIELLFISEGGGLPVAQALRLRDTLTENDGREFAQALLFDAPVGGNGLQIDKTSVAEVANLTQRTQVARHIGPDFQDILLFEQLKNRFGERDLVEPKEEAELRRGELKKRYAKRYSGAKRRTGFGIESDNVLFHQKFTGWSHISFVVDDADFAFEFDGRKSRRILVTDGI